jgi:hypothetical protein
VHPFSLPNTPSSVSHAGITLASHPRLLFIPFDRTSAAANFRLFPHATIFSFSTDPSIIPPFQPLRLSGGAYLVILLCEYCEKICCLYEDTFLIDACVQPSTSKTQV